MTERTADSSVTFLHPFTLPDVDGIQPPGTYLIETIEEALSTVSFLAYRRVSTTVTLPAVGTATLRKQIIAIDPKDLEAALKKDASARTGASALPSDEAALRA
jgi:hypothetical protein